MSPTHTAVELATIVSFVTETMLGIRFLPAGPDHHLPTNVFWKNASLATDGSSPLVVAVSADQHSCRALSASMFSCRAAEVDESMIDDSLCELVNMTAGRIKTAMGVDQSLTPPRIRTAREFLADATPGPWDRHLLRADGLHLVLSIASPSCEE